MAWTRWLFATLGALALFALAWGVQHWTRRAAWAEADAAGAAAAAAHAGLIGSELQKFRLLPLVLAEYPDVRAVLAANDAAAVRRLNDRLELFADRTDAAVIYVIGDDGRTRAASNWRLPESFVGQDYGFRPYFRQARAQGSAEMFALGTISGRPGLFIARRVEQGGRAIGVIVVKVEFDAVEAGWSRQPGITLVTDQHGVVVVTSRSDWRFRALRPLDAATRTAIRRAIQFGDLPLAPLVRRTTDGGTQFEDDPARYRIARVSAPLAGAHLWYLQPLEPAEARAWANARAALLAVAGLGLLLLALWWRARVRRHALEAARRVLEDEVAARTRDLRDANALLVRTSAERQDADRRFRAAREELAHANRLGSIGQITAGVAHEINQPVAAIRTFAENADRFLDRGAGDRVRENLAQIVALTGRIGRITGELRSFARRGARTSGTTTLDAVIDGTLLLIGDRVASAGIALERGGDGGDRKVTGDRIRLEQVLINLIQNAIEAIGDRGGSVRLETAATDDGAAITLADDGPGIAAEVAETLFTPFVTGKADGLGLGLGIARDIVREFGGTLSPVSSPLGGAAFRIELCGA